MKRAVATTTGATGGASGEFVVATLPGVPLPAEPGGLLVSHVIIDGFVNVSTGASTTLTALTLRCRRGTLTGTNIGPAAGVTNNAAVSTSYSIPFSFDDPLSSATPPTLPGQVYVITLTQTGTGLVNATINYAVCTATTS